jgi:hypothetical protein
MGQSGINSAKEGLLEETGFYKEKLSVSAYTYKFGDNHSPSHSHKKNMHNANRRDY